MYDIRNDILNTTEFGDITVDLTDRLTAEAGIEHFKEDYSTTVPFAQYFWQSTQSYYLQGSGDKNNGKFGLTYKLADHVLLYADWAQGYRPGGTNPVCGGSPGVSKIYQPDTLTNFEVGWKSVIDDGRLLWNGALYYMPWSDYQTRVYDAAVCIDEFFANIGNARIYGAESNVEYKPVEALTISASAAYNDPELLTNKFQSTTYIVLPGERLPNVPYFNYTAAVRYDMALGAESRGFLQVDDAHKGNRWNDLRAQDPYGDGRVLESAYDIANVRFGIIPSGSAWQAEAYVTNVTNRNANIFVSVANYDHRNETNQPRTFGIHLKYRLGGPK
jgi:outer membrane receptor protein involved in Fe transport